MRNIAIFTSGSRSPDNLQINMEFIIVIYLLANLM